MCAKGSLRNANLLPPNLMILKMKVWFGEELGTMKLIEEIIED